MGMQGGRPITFNFDLDDVGGEYALRCNTAELVFRPRSSSEARVYWKQEDFDNDLNYVEINGAGSSGEFRAMVSVSSVWLKGSGTLEVTAITNIG